MKSRVLLLSLLLGLTSSVSAATRYVNQATGHDVNNDCTAAQNPSTPTATINAGLGCTHSGDTLEIASGTYAECLKDFGPTPIRSGSSWSHPITLKAQAGHTVWLRLPQQCENEYGQFNFASAGQKYLVVDGLHMNGVNAYYNCAIAGQGVGYIRWQNIEGKHCGQVFQGGFEHSEFLNIHAHHNGWNEQGVETCPHPDLGCHGLYITGGHNRFTQITAHDNTGIGITLSCEGCGGSVTGNHIVDSVIRHNQGYGLMIYAGNTVERTQVCHNFVGIVSYPATLRGNRLLGNREGDLQLHGTGHVLEGNVVGEPGSGTASAECPAGPAPRPPPVPAPRNLRVLSVTP